MDRGVILGVVATLVTKNSLELRQGEVRRILLLKRLMCNSEIRRRSPDLMLHQTLSKGWYHARCRLLLGLIVRPRGRLVEGLTLLGYAQTRPSGLASRLGSTCAGHPLPMAPLQKRARLLAFRFFAPARILSHPLFAEPVQPAGACARARSKSLAPSPGQGTGRALGRLPRAGYYPHPGHREGESFSQRALLRAGFLRQERFEDRVGLRVQGRAHGEPAGRHHRLRGGRGRFRGAPHSGLAYPPRSTRALSGRQRVRLRWMGAALGLRAGLSGGGDSQGQLQEGMVSIAFGRPANARSSRGS